MCVALLLAAPTAALPVTEAPKKEATTFWSAAKKFFGMREHMKEHATVKTGTTLNITHPMAMPSQFALSYKKMVAWWCAKPENKAAHVCSPSSLAGASKAAASMSVPTATESKDIYKAFCGDKANKAQPVCMMAALKPPHVPASPQASAMKRAGAKAPGSSTTG